MADGARDEFKREFEALLQASGLQAKDVAAAVMGRRARTASWTLTSGRLSAWRTGRDLPAASSRGAFMLAVRIMTEQARNRAGRGHRIGRLLDEVAWENLLEKARAVSHPRSEPTESSAVNVIGDRLSRGDRDSPRPLRPEDHGMLTGSAASLPNRSSADLYKSYLELVVQSYDNVEWARRSITLECVVADKRKSLRDAIASWLEKPGRLLFITGGFGSGKTWAIRRTARDLAAIRLNSLNGAIPVVFNVGALHKLPLFDTSVLMALTWPKKIPDGLLSDDAVDIICIIDGLDEIVDAGNVDLARFREVLNLLSPICMNALKVIVGCRTGTLSLPGLREALDDSLGKVDLADRTEQSVRSALGLPDIDVNSLEILEVRFGDANWYLKNSRVGERWQSVSSQIGVRELVHAPFTIYMIEQAMEHLSRSELTLPRLYSTAVDVWLRRSGEPSRERTRLLEWLASYAANNIQIGADPIMESAAASIGVLTPTSVGYNFRHYSLAEYFYAQALYREVRDFSSNLLGRSDLVYSFNVNRFLVPLLLADKSILNPDNSEVFATWVTHGHFASFMKTSHWRSGGFGLWTGLDGRDSTPPLAGTELSLPRVAHAPFGLERPHIRKVGPVTAISWYDAQRYCHWVGGRLPTPWEAKQLLGETGKEIGTWTSTWYKEAGSLMATVFPKGARAQVSGVNPDLRLDGLGFIAVSPNLHERLALPIVASTRLKRVPYGNTCNGFSSRTVPTLLDSGETH